MDQKNIYKPSRFNFKTRNSNGDLVLYNSFSGAIGIVPKEEEALVERSLHPQATIEQLDGILRDLQENDFFVPLQTDEFAEATKLHQATFQKDDALQLIIMPTEECNFRCVYCYEDFKVKEMPNDVRAGLKNLVRNRASHLKDLTVAWFGGEPSEASDDIVELSEFFIDVCKQHDIRYRATMTTNGYNLRPELAKTFIEKCQITFYNITLDGLKEEHDLRRILKGGGETFDQIMANLIDLKQTDYEFYCQLRTNFDQNNLHEVPKLMDFIREQFEGDARFKVYYRNIGKWGGPNDDQLEVCDGSQDIKDMFMLHKTAKQKGLPLAMLEENLSPGNHVCYAALPWNFVIGADGTIYKCTVALDKDYNKVGRIQADGTLDIDEAKMALWTGSNESIDSGCQRCFFRPSCQGAACPLIRIEDNMQPCPPVKTHLKYALDVLTL